MSDQLNEKEIFNQARAIESPDSRERYLRQVCGDNHEALARVIALLSSFEQAESFLEAPVNELAATIESDSEGVGTRIGPYELVEQIGEGGMGIVYMADQHEPIRRTVAIKVIKPGMDTSQVLARFEAERQTLAMMNHPNIAKVLDAGTTDAGRPFFVMELVRGIPVNEFCDKHKYDSQQRLELFTSICQAAQHAHLKGIIHRDLKPSNILVELHDVKAVPKVIDFGVAKAVGRNLGNQTRHTGFTQIIGTPLYMSPEQAELSGLDVDLRSDVYSLGVILYELLTGTTPFASDTLKRAGYDEMRRIIREEDPAKPSDRISTLDAEELSTVSINRSADARRLVSRIRGDLDWIVMKSLEKDRTRRYESASSLADDVERHLNDQPVIACPPTLGYRFAKFARRNKGGLLAVSLLVASALAGLIGLIISNQLITEQRNEAERQRARAEANYRQAREAVDEYLFKVSSEKLLEIPELQELRKELLGSALSYYERFVADHKEDDSLQIDLMSALFQIALIERDYGMESEYEKYGDMLIQISKRVLETEPNNIDFKYKLAGVYSIIVAARAPNVDKKMEALNMSIPLYEEAANAWPNNLECLGQLQEALRVLGHLYSQQSMSDLASEMDAKALRVVERMAEIDNEEFRRDVITLTERIARNKGKDSLESLVDQVAALRALAIASPTEMNRRAYASSLGNQAIELNQRDRTPEAISAIEECIEITLDLKERDPLDSRHLSNLIRAYRLLSAFQTRLGLKMESMDSSRKGLDITKKLIERHPNATSSRIGLTESLARSAYFIAEGLREAAQFDEALRFYLMTVNETRWIASNRPDGMTNLMSTGVVLSLHKIVGLYGVLGQRNEIEGFLESQLESWLGVEKQNFGQASVECALYEVLTFLSRTDAQEHGVERHFALLERACERIFEFVDDDITAGLALHHWHWVTVQRFRERDWVGVSAEARKRHKYLQYAKGEDLHVTPFLWLGGDRDGFRRSCNSVLDGLDPEADELPVLINAVRLCTLDPDVIGRKEEVLGLAMKIRERAPDDTRTFLRLAIARAQYRAGQYQQALSELKDILQDPRGYSEVVIRLDLSIAHHLNGETRMAREYYGQVLELFQAEGYRTKEFELPGHERSEFEVLRLEARDLLETEVAPPT